MISNILALSVPDEGYFRKSSIKHHQTNKQTQTTEE
jgi:hypothetical protein